ncbi:MAG: Ig-like domain-containing protein, partial [Acidimicrobiia bacterium]|nr:Ig-like domain-containing protein [Acidimicrobiia bacterium]
MNQITGLLGQRQIGRRSAALIVVLGMVFSQLVVGGVAPAQAQSAVFQQGVGGYFDTVDIGLDPNQPDAGLGDATSIEVRGSADDNTDRPGLVRFENLFGSGPGQIPIGSTITSARLTLTGLGDGKKKDSAGLYQLLVPWDDDATWNSMMVSGPGIQRDDVEAATVAGATVSDLSQTTLTFTVTSAVQDWSDGDGNFGWALSLEDGATWTGHSSEAEAVSDRPLLTIDFDPPNRPPVATDDSVSTPRDTAVTVAVLDNDSDPDGDLLSLVAIGDSAGGTVVANGDGTVTYKPVPGFVGQDTFSYALSDGRGATATGIGTVQVTEPAPVTTTTEVPLKSDRVL